jgi:hypothetical protein
MEFEIQSKRAQEPRQVITLSTDPTLMADLPSRRKEFVNNTQPKNAVCCKLLCFKFTSK